MNKKLNCVLFVDDDEFTNLINVKLVESVKVTEHIQVCCTGKDALEFLTNSGEYKKENEPFPCPDIIFLDINMPGMNGWEFLEEYNKLPKTRRDNLIIVMLTTSLNPEDEITANKLAYVTAFRHKPLTVPMINEIIQTYFPEVG
ncbi:response regulator [Chitinophaga sp.]|uniref:response regulator n=1 Tax=Chitinophaga sp. TaxID=1869181 RepID=UPI0031DA038E